MRRLRWRAVSLVGVTLLAVACATATRTVTPIGVNGPFEPDADERALWARAEKEEDALLKKALPYDDPLLAQYLTRVADRLTPGAVRAAGGPAVGVTVIRDPSLNAFAMPDGKIYVHTGLLSRLDNEAQLATILGHEITHVTHRHALSVQRQADEAHTRHDVVATTASIGTAAATGSTDDSNPMGAALLGQTASAILGQELHVAAIAAIDGYGRDREREADEGALQSLVDAGYDPREAPKVFEVLRSESTERGPLETFFFGNRRKLTERIATTSEMVRTRYAAAASSTAVRDTDEFQLRLRAVVRENAGEDIRAGRFAVARRQLDRVLAATPRDALAHLYYGELHRLQSQRARDAAEQAQSADLARASYEKAAEIDPALAEPHRQLGFLYYQQRQTALAREAFRRYLALKPDAPDAKRIEAYVTELDR